MRIEVPTGARLQNIEAFMRRIRDVDEPGLELVIPSTYFNVHPMVLAAIAAAGLHAQASGGSVSCPMVPQTNSARYLERAHPVRHQRARTQYARALGPIAYRCVSSAAVSIRDSRNRRRGRWA